MAVSPTRTVFGVPLELLPEVTGAMVPQFVWDAVQQLTNLKATKRPQIFRESISKQVKEEWISALQSGQRAVYDNNDPIAVGELLKTFFMMLPEPLISDEIVDRLYEAGKGSQSDFALLSRIIPAITCMPLRNQRVLEFLISFLHEVAANSDENKMNAEALGVVFGPSLCRVSMSTTNALQKQIAVNNVIRVMILHVDSHDLFLEMPLILGNLLVAGLDTKHHTATVYLAGSYLNVLHTIKLAGSRVAPSAKSTKEWTLSVGPVKYRFRCDSSEEVRAWLQAVGTVIATCRASSLPPHRVYKEGGAYQAAEGNTVAAVEANGPSSPEQQHTSTPPARLARSESLLKRRQFMSAPTNTSPRLMVPTRSKSLAPELAVLQITVPPPLERLQSVDSAIGPLATLDMPSLANTHPSPGTDDEHFMSEGEAAEKDSSPSPPPQQPMSPSSQPRSARKPRTLSERLDLPHGFFPSSHTADGIAETSSELIHLATSIREQLRAFEAQQESPELKQSLAMSAFALNSAESLLDEMRWTIRTQSRDLDRLHAMQAALLDEIRDLKQQLGKGTPKTPHTPSSVPSLHSTP